MKAQQAELYQSIQEFSLDDPGAAFPFSKRLARENGWTVQYTQRAINEYKKFIFLAVVAGHPVTPSDQVDRVWHLHLTYTHSYWNEFCDKVLKKPLHHHPTKGGSSEQDNFYRCYNETLNSYEKLFGQQPPSDIWSPPDTRFGKDIQCKQVNTHRYWLVPKPSFTLAWLPSIYLPRLPLGQFLAIALLSFILVLTISSSTLLIAGISTQTTHSTSSELALAQTSENSPLPRKTPTPTPKNKDRPTSEKSSGSFWWWLPIFLIFSLFGSRGNNSRGGSSGSNDSTNNGCGCGCM
ncbi:hypothetical protein [Coleofasciculus sp. FACHB-SPT36]|uniref:glycine-rich domain-containing protein n=1 Tax=Cyanophyceae TaxID=3028117 RepID=UPI00168A5149|nr:hypothetical protein [Coleofasciculus sp. FACHB-SPT36]MBD2539928.1 hypothetical protein [Coleofasciculus sp. FACHB-SPT36]